jgi:hypothetical protein
LSNPRMLDWYANFDRRSKHHRVRIFSGWNGRRVLISSETEKILAFARVEALKHFSNTSCGWHIAD